MPAEVRVLTPWLGVVIAKPTRISSSRYLRAAKWNVEKAVERLESTLKWRREFGVYTHTPEYLEPEVRSLSLHSPRGPLTMMPSKVCHRETDPVRL